MSTIQNSRRPLPTASRGHRLAGTLLMAGALAGLLVSCGGGTDVAPADPSAEGDGLASATLDGVGYSNTTLVESVASVGSSETLPVTDEAVTFAADDTAQLSQGPQSATGPVTVTGPGGTPDYDEGTDYTIDRQSGMLTRLPGGAIPPEGTVEVDYEWVRTFYDVSVGATFVAGASVEVRFFNIDPNGSYPLTIPNSETSPPATFEPAFNVVLDEDLTESTGRRTFITVNQCDTSVDPVDCPVMNVAVLSDAALANILNPCVAGSVSVTLTNQNDSDPSDRSVLTLEFDDPVCD